MTGKENQDLIQNGNKPNTKSWEMPPLTVSEARQVFRKNISESEFSEINTICKNNAGKLVFIRNLVTIHGITLQNILDNISNNDMESIFRFLWDRYSNQEDDLQQMILATIAFQQIKYPLNKIAKILAKSESDIQNSINEIPFVQRNNRGEYEFIFEGVRRFIAKKLSKYKPTIDNTVIDYLLKNQNTEEALINLPEMYKETGRYEDIIKLLSGDKWKTLLKESESISIVKRVCDIALEASQKDLESKNIPLVLKYSTLKSSLKELSQTRIWQQEIAANLVLEDYISAITLADLAFLKEDRLKLFAFIAKSQVQRKQEVTPSLIKKINDLYDLIDFKVLGKKTVEIASLLIYSIPKLAFRLIETLSGTEGVGDNDNAFDWALAQISFSSYELTDREDLSKEDIDSKIYSKIRNSKIKDFAEGILFISANQSIEGIKNKIAELENTSQKLFLLRNWILKNREHDNIVDVIEMGIELVVDKSDRYVPNANDFKIFATPLPYIKDKIKTSAIIEKIEKNVSSIEKNSNRIDLLQINLLIAQSLYAIESSKGEEKLSKIYDNISKLSDLAVKATCLSMYANTAKNIQGGDFYADIANKDISDSIDNILNQTAQHYEIVKDIIINLVKPYTETTFNICKKLNNSNYRDNAFLESLSVYLKRQSLNDINFDFVGQFFNQITDLDIKEIALYEIIDRLKLEDELSIQEKEGYIAYFQDYFNQIDDLIDNKSKAMLYVKVIYIMQNYENQKERQEIVIKKLKKSWGDMEISADKIELGFEIAYEASFLKDKCLAYEFIKLAKEVKELFLLDSPNTVGVYYLCIELTVRLLASFIYKSDKPEEDIEKLKNLIDVLPSENYKIKAWSVLILKMASRTSEELPKKIIREYVLPSLSKIKSKPERIEIIIEIAPVLYLFNALIPELKELPNSRLKDIFLSRIVVFLMTKCVPDDPCNDEDEGYDIDYNSLQKVVNLIKLMSNDYAISHYISEVRKCINSKKTKISNQQKISLKETIENIANTKLPDKINIKHIGYQVLVKGYALSTLSISKKKDWEAILEEAEKVPNLSDQIYLWISIATLMPNKHELEGLRKELIEKAHTKSYELPSFLDTLNRIGFLLSILAQKKIQGINIKDYFNKFIQVQQNKESYTQLHDTYKNILDAMHMIDPEIAKSMVTVIDSDSARRNTGAYLSNRLEFLNFQEKNGKQLYSKSNLGKEKELIGKNTHYLDIMTEKNLAILNGTKRISDERDPKDLLFKLEYAAEKSIYDSYNSYLYFIERLVIKFENSNDSERVIRKSFSELINVCELIKLFAIHNSEKIKSLFDLFFQQETSSDATDYVTKIKEDIGEEQYNKALQLLKTNASIDVIGNVLNISNDLIEKIKNFTDKM
ncbi:MAG: hypothetical protein MUE81_08685 [Thermoflexibacter sp.]|nr:hypothetical protein [Thermoflexibacter sp.]